MHYPKVLERVGSPEQIFHRSFALGAPDLGEFEIRLNQPRWPMEFIHTSTFSTCQYRKKGACLDFIFARFVIYPLVIVLAPVVQRLDNAIHRINRYPADKC